MVAVEFERVEQQVRRGAVSTLQIQKLLDDLAEKATPPSLQRGTAAARPD